MCAFASTSAFIIPPKGLCATCCSLSRLHDRYSVFSVANYWGILWRAMSIADKDVE